MHKNIMPGQLTGKTIEVEFGGGKGMKAVLEITNGAGKRCNNCPRGIRPAIEKAIKRGQASGTVAGGGQLWRWNMLLPETVTLQFTRDDVVVEEIQIPATGWAAFQIVAHQHNVEPRSWLTAMLGKALADGVSVQEAVRWLFPSKCSDEFHGRHAE